MGLFEDMFTESNEANLVKQMNHKYDTISYTIILKETGEMKTEDTSLVYKIKNLLKDNNIDFDIMEENLN